MLNYSWNVLQFKASESAAGGAEEELKSSCCSDMSTERKKKSENCGSPTEGRHASRVSQLGVWEAL